MIIIREKNGRDREMNKRNEEKLILNTYLGRSFLNKNMTWYFINNDTLFWNSTNYSILIWLNQNLKTYSKRNE